ncbi:MAG: hypothetical protein WKF96_07785 [Solirubrobacteraceae bacterium]
MERSITTDETVTVWRDSSPAPAQWKTERQDAHRVEDDYRAAVADWQPQRPPSPVT